MTRNRSTSRAYTQAQREQRRERNRLAQQRKRRQQADPTPRCPVCGEPISAERDCKCP